MPDDRQVTMSDEEVEVEVPTGPMPVYGKPGGVQPNGRHSFLRKYTDEERKELVAKVDALMDKGVALYKACRETRITRAQYYDYGGAKKSRYKRHHLSPRDRTAKIQEILALLDDGFTRGDACEIAGIRVPTYRLWEKNGYVDKVRNKPVPRMETIELPPEPYSFEEGKLMFPETPAPTPPPAPEPKVEAPPVVVQAPLKADEPEGEIIMMIGKSADLAKALERIRNK